MVFPSGYLMGQSNGAPYPGSSGGPGAFFCELLIDVEDSRAVAPNDQGQTDLRDE